MTSKEKMIHVIEQLPENASVDAAIERLYLLRKVETGLQQADAGDVIEHDDLLKQLGIDE